MPHVTTRYEREKLYEEVWSHPVTKVAEQYGVSDVAIRKICVKLKVPLPPRGYWARISAGQQLRKTPLPKFTGASEIVRHRFVPEAPAVPPPPEPEHVVSRREFETRPESRIVVADTLDEPHRFVRATRHALKSRSGRDARNWPRGYGIRALEVAVSQESVDRALRIMDALAKALASRGMPFAADGDEHDRPHVKVQGEKLSVRLSEKSTRTERQPTVEERQYMKRTGSNWYPNRYVYNSTGALSLAVNGEFGISASCSDGKSQRLEDRLNDFVIALEEVAARQKRTREEHEEQRREWDRQEEVRRKKEWARSEEMQKLKELEEEAQQWRRAENIRAYVASVEASHVEQRIGIDAKSELGRWIAWARSRADWLDPRIGAACQILDA
jgi:hypothetical protein